MTISNLKHHVRRVGLAAGLLVATVASSQATVFISSSPDFDAPVGQFLIDDFDGFLAPGFTLSGGEIIIGDQLGPPQTAAAPWVAAGTYLFGPMPADGDDPTYYLNLRPDGFTPTTLTSPTPLSQFSLYWGSIDTYNSISFYRDATPIQTVTGADVSSVFGNQNDFLATKRVNFAFTGLQPNRIVLDTTQIAFEVDNFAGAVPEPGTWAMLLIGFAGIGFALRRQKRDVSGNLVTA